MVEKAVDFVPASNPALKEVEGPIIVAPVTAGSPAIRVLDGARRVIDETIPGVAGPTRVVEAVYDFASDGGAIGTVVLKDRNRNPLVIPAGSLITRSWTQVLTAPTAGGAATVALSVGAGVLLGATLISDATFVGVGTISARGSNVTPVLAAAASISMAIAAFALTAGKIRVMVEFIPPF